MPWWKRSCAPEQEVRSPGAGRGKWAKERLRSTDWNCGHPPRATLSFSPKDGIWLMEETPNWASSPGMVRVRGSFAVHCLSHEEGTWTLQSGHQSLGGSHLHANLADWLLGQTLDCMLLKRNFLDVIDTRKELTCSKLTWASPNQLKKARGALSPQKK